MAGCETCEELELVKFNCSLDTSKEDKTHPKNAHHANRNRGLAKTLAVLILKHAPTEQDKLLQQIRHEALSHHPGPNAEPVIHAPRIVPVRL